MLKIKVNKNTFNSIKNNKNNKMLEKIFFNKCFYKKINLSTIIQWEYNNEIINTKVNKVQTFKDLNEYKVDFSTNEKNKEYYDNVHKYGIKVVNFSLFR